MNKDLLHQHILKHKSELSTWFEKQQDGLYVPFYSSYDIRDAGYKIANVDANIYPAGFNNICEADRDHSEELVKTYITRHYGSAVKKIGLLTEEHTSNPYYWQNVFAILHILSEAGYEVKVMVPPITIKEAFVAETILGNKVEVHLAEYKNNKLEIPGFQPDLIISNNDFSKSYLEWAQVLDMPVNPPRELGWYQRKKSQYFSAYNELAEGFAEVINVDPWTLQVPTELFSNFDVTDEKSRHSLAEVVDGILKKTTAKYKEMDVTEKPFVFIKNNSGTYGLGVIQVSSAEEVISLNYKSKKKMKAAKGGRDVDEVIVQEGIPSIVKSDTSTAEPAIYMIGCQLAGGFLRTHREKSDRESLNSPGAVYQRLCVSDLEINVEGRPLENVYGWVAKLGALAIGRETQSMKVSYNGYQLKKCNE